MVYRYDCNGFFNQIRLGSYQLALPVPGILKLCIYLQNVGAKTYIFGLQLSTFLFYNKQSGVTVSELAATARTSWSFFTAHDEKHLFSHCGQAHTLL